ncbi:MAG: ABC transporter permease [Clostridiaceae bacterium]
MITLIQRNLKLFFKDKTVVLFSLLSTLIVLGLYILFLGRVTFSELADFPGINLLTGSWVMSGILAILPVNASLGSLTAMLVDKEKGTYEDLIVTPLSRLQIIGGYVLSTFLVSLILSAITLLATEAYLFSLGGALLSLGALVDLLFKVILNTLITTLILFCVSLFFKNLSAYSLFNSILGTVIGFLTGTLIPIGELSNVFQKVVLIFPFSHSAAMFRKILMEGSIKTVFAGADSVMVQNFRQTMGIDLMIYGKPITDYASILYLLFWGMLGLLISLVRLKQKP